MITRDDDLQIDLGDEQLGLDLSIVKAATTGSPPRK
jgi:hypothetical protein